MYLLPPSANIKMAKNQKFMLFVLVYFLVLIIVRHLRFDIWKKNKYEERRKRDFFSKEKKEQKYIFYVAIIRKQRNVLVRKNNIFFLLWVYVYGWLSATRERERKAYKFFILMYEWMSETHSSGVCCENVIQKCV